MSALTVHGKGHRALAMLETGPATYGDILSHSGLSGAQSRKLWFLMRAMERDGLVSRDRGLYAITPYGRDALKTLRLGQDFLLATEAAA